ncbi:MAG: nucleotidyl transferase AbiEii/AbiGii toxin family protein [bacterium]
MQSILSENQKKILSLLSNEKDIFSNFYLGGGTALAEFYLKHRLSEDLDFFSENEFDPLSISVILKKMQDIMGIKKVEYTNSFNRNLFFLDLEDGDKIKTEFTFFPFPRIDKKNKMGSLFIDSMQDIAVNKVFTIYQNPRSRDFIDLYFILQKEKDWSLDDLIKNAQVKFDTYLDPIQLGTQYMKAKELKDYPKMITKIDDEVWQEFFIKEAKKLKGKIIE